MIGNDVGELRGRRSGGDDNRPAAYFFFTTTNNRNRGRVMSIDEWKKLYVIKAKESNLDASVMEAVIGRIDEIEGCTVKELEDLPLYMAEINLASEMGVI